MQLRSPVYGLRVDGSEIQLEVTISKIEVGNETEMTAVIRDITERTRMIEQLKQEFALAMKLSGAARVRDIHAGMLVPQVASIRFRQS